MDLLGCHVGRGPEHGAHPGEPGIAVAQHPSEPEVRHTRDRVGGIPLVEKHIRWLQVAMQDPGCVGVVHTSNHASREVERLLRSHRTPEESFRETPPIHEVHEKGWMTMEIEDVGDRKHVRMAQPRLDPPFFDEAMLHRRTGDVQDLECMQRVEGPVTDRVDRSRSPATKHGLDPVAFDLRPDGQHEPSLRRHRAMDGRHARGETITDRSRR